MPKGVYKRTDYHRKIISESHKGLKPSDETRKKMSDSHKGKKAWNKGKKLGHRSEETKRKISESHKGKIFSIEQREKISESLKGNKNAQGCIRTPKQREKISESLKGRKPWNKGKRLSPEYTGKNAGNYIHGKSIKHQNWRNSILDRDNYTCQMCFTKIELEVHHIKRRKEYPEFLYDVDYGITLCKICHGITKFKEKMFEKLFQAIIELKKWI